MPTKHRAKVLADILENNHYDDDMDEWDDAAKQAYALLRTIPALEDEIEKLKAEDDLERGQYHAATMYLNRIGIPKNDEGVELSLLGRFNLFVKARLRQQQAEREESDKIWEQIVIKYDKDLRQKIAEIEALKAKTLTDEEIQDLMVESGFIMHDFYSVKIFAEAILRKAQEK